jgi:hypothetical protein
MLTVFFGFQSSDPLIECFWSGPSGDSGCLPAVSNHQKEPAAGRNSERSPHVESFSSIQNINRITAA